MNNIKILRNVKSQASYRMVSLTATDLVVALKEKGGKKGKQSIRKSGRSARPRVRRRQSVLTFILCVVLMKLAIQALMSSFTPTTGDQTHTKKGQTPSITTDLCVNFTL